MKYSNLLLLLILALLLGANYSLAGATVDRADKSDAQVGGADVELPRGEDSRFLTGPNEGEPLEIALEYLDKSKDALGLTSADLADVLVTDQYTSQHNGVTHIYLRQRHQGIEVFNANLNINIGADGSVINLGHSFVANLAEAVNTSTPSLSTTQAVESAAQELSLNMIEPLSLLEEIGGPANEVLLSDGGISLNDIPVKLMYQSSGNANASEVRLAWNVVIYETSAKNWWDMRVDALTGQTLDQKDWVVHDYWGQEGGHDHASPTGADRAAALATCTATGASEEYCVYAMPLETPNHGNRSMETDPADSTASPYGWHDTNGATGAESNYTVGNNVDAYEDTNKSNRPTDGNAARADGGANHVFNFDVDLTQAPSTYQDAAITNLFYWNNIIHDVFYQYGFDEASGNFQENNYGNGGSASDRVNAEAQDGGGTNNANFATPPDGRNPRMQMYLWTQTSPRRDGDFDNGIIIHEYGHGISIRLTGGPSNSSCLSNRERAGEGWSDWFGLMLTMKAGDMGPDKRGIGSYVLGQPTDGDGIRPALYSTDMGINNYTYGNIGSLSVPHGVGFVWATMIWDMNWALIDQHGFDADIYGGSGGNNIAMQLVVDGLKLQPCSPGFVDARDAILLADQTNNAGANQCLIWEAFAKRGLGYSANQGSSGSTTDGTEAFDMPPACGGEVPDINVNPTSISVTVPEGDRITETLTIGNVGSGTLNWNISTSAGNEVVGEWTLFYDWGCVGSPDSAIVTFYEDFTFTTNEGYEGTWVLSGNEIVFTYTGGTEYTGTVDGDSMAGTMISYTGSTGCWTAERVTGMSGYVTLQSGEYTDSGDRAEEPGATTEYFVNRSDWLSANPTSGTEAASASTDVTVGLDATNLTAGTYNDTLTITSNDPDEATVEVPVTLMVVPAASPDIDVNPTSISLTVPEGDRITETLTIGNVGAGTLNWNISTSTGNEVVGEWTLFYDWGCVGSPESAIWTFYEDFTFTDSYEDSGTWVLSGNEVVITYTSGAEYTGTVDGDSMAGTMNSDLALTGCWTAERVTGMSAYVTLQSGEYTASGEPAEEPGATSEYFVNRSDWLSANPTSGTEAAGASTEVTVGLDATNLTAGTYNDTLTITSNDPDEATVEVPVTLTVVNANPTVISDVRTTNVRDVSFTVSWLTDVAASGQVRYGTDPNNLNQTGEDVRGASTSDDTHYVLVQNLSPETTYYFDLLSGETTDDNGGSHYSVTTGPTLTVPGSDTIFGEVKKSDGTTPAAGTIVYITLEDGNRDGTSGQAAPLSALVANDGFWTTNLGNARIEELSAYFSYSASGDQLFLEAEGGADGEACQSVDTGSDDPAATIELGNSPCLISWDIDLQQGWNKIALPIELTNPITAQEVCDQISSQGGDIAEINRWEAGGWEGHICGLTFSDFTLEMNSGYFIKSNTASTWSIEGVPVSSATLELQIGWNSISLPHTDGYTAESLCDEIITQGVTALEIDRWHAGGWEGHICGQTFNDFDINRDKGYFVKTTSAGPVTPPAVAALAQPPEEGLPEVGPAMPIRDLVVGNLRDTSVTISWTTEEATTGYVRVSSRNPENQRLALDIRGASTSSRTHFVLLDNLAAETTYQLEVISGLDGAETTQITVTTAPTLESLPPSDTIYGQAFQADGVTPAADALVHLTLEDADGAGSTGEAMRLSALVDAEGYWHANLGNARTAELNAYFNYSPQGDQLFIKAQGTDQRTTTLTVDTAEDAQAPNMTLASIPTAVKVATYDAAPASTPWQGGALLVTFLLAAAGWWHRKK